MKSREENHNAISFHSPWRVDSVVGAGILLCAFLVSIYCIWTLDRGFEITDEAYYLLLAMHADSVKFYISAQQWITAGLWQVTGNVMMFRAAGLVFLLASSALLAFGVFSACLRFELVVDRYESKIVVLSGSLIGAMLYASTINLSPCYNLLASAGAYTAAGVVLLALTRSSITHKYVLFVIAGGTMGAEAICKPSAGIATLALLAFWVSIFERSHFDKTFGLVAMVFGAITFAGILLLVNTTIGETIEAFEQGMQLFRMVQVETIGERLIRYCIDFLAHSLITLNAFVIPIVAMVIYAMKHRAIFSQIGLVSLIIILVFGGLEHGLPTFSTHNATYDGYLFGGFDVSTSSAPIPRAGVQIVAIFAILIMTMIVSIPVWNKNRNTLALFVGLILLPYSVAIGTGNALFLQVIDSLASWGALITVLVVARYPDNFNKIPTSLIGVCFIVTIALQIVTSSLRPYQLTSALTKQNQPTVIEGLGRLKVDADTYKFLTDLKAATKECDIAPGVPFIGLYNIPGVALALQAVPVFTPWLNNWIQAQYVTERVRSEELKSTVVALQMVASGVFPPLPKRLASFPWAYRYCGMATYPYNQQRIQIWQSRAR